MVMNDYRGQKGGLPPEVIEESNRQLALAMARVKVQNWAAQAKDSSVMAVFGGAVFLGALLPWDISFLICIGAAGGWALGSLAGFPFRSSYHILKSKRRS